MIKASELRIGNYIEDPECAPHIFQIEEIRKHVGYRLWAFYRSGSIKSVEVVPVPITEDWLEKFGFERVEDGFVKGEMMLNGSMELVWYELTPLSHVHQLQNLYFALTGHELTLKLSHEIHH